MLTNRAYTMYRYGLDTVRHVVFDLIQIPRSSSCSKCPRDETAGDEVFPQRNGRRRSVPATKWLATKCTRNEMAGDEVYPPQNGGDEKAATKRQRRNVLLRSQWSNSCCNPFDYRKHSYKRENLRLVAKWMFESAPSISMGFKFCDNCIKKLAKLPTTP